MMQPQVNLNSLKPMFEQAIAHPESADLAQLWVGVEHSLARLERGEQLRAAGEAIAQLADVYYARAEWMLKVWDERWSDRPPEEPVLSNDMLSGFLRQTMVLNLDDLLEEFVQTRNRNPADDSVVGEVEKQAVLDWLEQDDKEKALAVAHDENVTAWVELIQHWLTQQEAEAWFTQLISDMQHHAHVGRVALWLGLLLGGFCLQPGEEFYARDFKILGKP